MDTNGLGKRKCVVTFWFIYFRFRVNLSSLLQLIQDILSPEHIETYQCVEHHCGMDSNYSWKTAQYQIDCAEGGDSIPRYKGESLKKNTMEWWMQLFKPVRFRLQIR